MAKRNSFSGWPHTVRKEIVMKRFRAFGPTLGLLIASTLVVPLAHADEADEATRFTFVQPVRIPDKLLPAGSYWFVLIDHGADLNVVQIFDADRKSLIVTLQTAAAERLNPSSETTLTLAEPERTAESSGGPATLISWFYPGRVEGHRFIYTGQLEKTLEHEDQVTLASDSSGSIVIAQHEAK
jgi:hypothetical protein